MEMITRVLAFGSLVRDGAVPAPCQVNFLEYGRVRLEEKVHADQPERLPRGSWRERKIIKSIGFRKALYRL